MDTLFQSISPGLDIYFRPASVSVLVPRWRQHLILSFLSNEDIWGSRIAWALWVTVGFYHLQDHDEIELLKRYHNRNQMKEGKDAILQILQIL